MFRNRDWESDGAPNIRQFIEDARNEIEGWKTATLIAPHDVVKPTRFANKGSALPADALKDDGMRELLEHLCLEGMHWGLGNQDDFWSWYQAEAEGHARKLPKMRESGLIVEALPDLPQFLADAEEILRNFEQDIGALPAVPERLLRDMRALGLDV